MPLAVIVPAAFCAWRFIPESPVRVSGRSNWLAAALMSTGISAVLLAVSETTSLYLLPSTIGMVLVGSFAGRIAGRFGSKTAVIAGSIFSAGAFALIAVEHCSPVDMLVSSALMGIGIGLAFSRGNLIVQAVDPHQTGAAGGMNTVMRTIGGAIGGQLSATFVAGHVAEDGLPLVTGFTLIFAMAACFMVVCTLSALLIPGRRARAAQLEPALAGDSPRAS